MKGDSRLPYPVLKDEKLDFFYSILTLCESPKKPKIVNNFNSAEIRQLKKKKDKKGHLTLRFSDIGEKTPLQLSEIRFRNVKGNKGLSILWHLRHAFAHNRINLSEDGEGLHIENEYRGEVKFKAMIAYDVLKELIETLLGQHNVIEEEKQN
ncbi:MAG: hypothetical protein K2J78_13075 [Muribaculaceae bacterium]|nr:hypothetical protein [Muribaculaceae bacterium]